MPTAFDYGAGIDSVSAFSQVQTDSGTGAELAMAPWIGDDAHGDELISARSVACFDVGIGQDVAPDVFEQAVGAEIVSLNRTFTDSGVSADSVQLVLSIADSGVSADSIPLLAITQKDHGFGTETVLFAPGYVTSDHGAGLEFPSLSAAYTATESGTGNDSVTMSFAALLPDAGTGTDSVSGVFTFLGLDIGISAETTSFQPSAGPQAEHATTIEVVTLSAVYSVTDAGTGNDSAAFLGAYSTTDSGTGADSVTGTFIFLGLDIGIAHEVLSWQPSAGPQADAATTFEIATLAATMPPATDMGSGADSVSLAVQFTAADSGAGADLTQAFGMATLAYELAQGRETASVQTAYVLSDSGAGLETAVPLPPQR